MNGSIATSALHITEFVVIFGIWHANVVVVVESHIFC